MKFKIKIIISILTLIIDMYCGFIFINMHNSYYSPTSPKIDISSIFNKNILTETDYSLLFEQTGLAKPAIDDLLSQKNGPNKIKSYQTGYFTKQRIFTEKLSTFTSQESLMVNGSMNNRSFQIAPIRNGDILLTKSTHTLYWRHGHCGIVIDAKNGITLESLEPGTVSMQRNISIWQSYPTFKLMRLKGVNQEKLNEIASYAAKNYMGIKYGLLTSKKSSKPESINCSQLLYQVFQHYGYNIDSNKGIFVTPEDIAKSKLLDTVQIYGFNPQNSW